MFDPRNKTDNLVFIVLHVYRETNYVTDPKFVLQVQLYSFVGSSLNGGIHTSCILYAYV